MFDLDIDCSVILCGNISNNDIALLKKIKNIKIAADGAANILIKNNINPNYIVGDLDSFNFENLHSDTQLINISTQEQYDFEKCLDVAISKKMLNVLIFGINGGLLDHTLNNWSIFIKYLSCLNLFLYSEGQIGSVINDDISFKSEENEIISIIPFPMVVLTTEGLKWELNNTTLEFGKLEGARNQTINKEVSIKLHSGKYILFKKYKV